MYAERLLPHDLVAEEAVLGAALIDGGATALLAGRLTPEDFYREKHAAVWAGLLALHHQRRAIDQVTLARQLASAGTLDAVGGMAFLSHLVAVTPTSANAPYYADIVAEKSRGRQIINLAGKLAADVYDGANVEQAAGQAALELLKGRGVDNEQPQSASQLYDKLQSDLLDELDSPAKSLLQSRPTGYLKLNQMINGWENGLFYVLGARTSMGKTLVALNLALKAAAQNYQVLIFSLELSSVAVYRRLASNLANFDRYVHHRLDAREREKSFGVYAESLNTLQAMPIWISSRRGLRPVDIQSVMTRHVAEHGPLDLVIVDYLNLVRPERGSRSRYESMTDTVGLLKDIGGNMDVPMLVAAQLNRAPENRPEQGKRPTLADFRDTGAIEEVASVVMALYRPAYYYPTRQDWERVYDTPWPEKELEIIVLKNQEGPVGKQVFEVNPATGGMREAPNAV